MQRCAVLSLLVLLVATMTGCGSDDKKPTPVTPASITIAPSFASLEVGRFTTLVATVKDASGNTINGATVTWSSSNTAVADVTANGSVCAGKWDSLTAPTVCNPGPVSTATITATSGGVSSSVTIYTHLRIARLAVTAAGSGCTSQGQTQAFFFSAADANGNDISATVGPVNWTVSDATVGTINENGVVTAKRPGQALVNASVSGTTALPAAFTTCPPAAITLSQQGNPGATDFTVSPPQTTVLAATVIDTKGNPITDLALSFTSSAPGVASVVASGLTATVTANAAGRAGVIASCTPNSCNQGLGRPIYSNVAGFTVSGTTSPKVVAASFNSNNVAIIDSTNAVVASPAIPAVTVSGTTKNPILNSVVMAGDGSKAFFGSDVGVLVLDLNTNAFLQTVYLFPGKVMAASADGGKVLVGNGSFSIIDVNANTAATHLIVNLAAADISQDLLRVYAVTGSTLNSINRSGSGLTAKPLAAPATDVRFLKQSSIAFVAEPGANAQIFATCDDSSLGSAAAQPQLLASANDSSRMFGANGTTFYSIVPTITPPATPISDPELQKTTCAPQVSTAVAAAAIGTTVSARQLIAAPNGGRAFLLADAPAVYSYNATSNAVAAIPLAGGANATTGGVTPDGAVLYVGTTAGDVERIDVASGVVLQRIAAGLKRGDGSAAFPDLVAVRPR